MDEKKVTVYMMIGFPGAGKDTWIKNHMPDTPSICVDNVRCELGFSDSPDIKIGNDPEQEKIVRITCFKRLIEYVENGQDVIVNSPNLYRKKRDWFKTLLSDYNIRWIYIVVEAPDRETVVKRRAGQIDARAFTRMFRKYEPPTPDEYDEIIYDKQEKI